MREREPGDRRWMSRPLGQWLMALFCISCCSVTLAQAKPAPASPKNGKQPAASPKAAAPIAQSSTDVVRLNGSKTVRGVIVYEHTDKSLTLAVTREWLRKSDAKNLARLEVEEFATRRTVFEQLRDRIRNELPSRPNDSAVAFLLKSELDRAEKVLAENDWQDRPQFLWVEVPAKNIGKVTRATPERRRIAMWSWHENLADVETRSAQDLVKELKANNVDPTQPPPDLSERFPGRPQDDREWNARMGLVSYSLDSPRDYHGTGDVLLRAERNANRVNLASLIQQYFSGDLDSFLNKLSGIPEKRLPPTGTSNRWLNDATVETEKDKLLGLRATRVDLNLAGREAAVRTVFRARVENLIWETIWEARDVQSADKERESMEALILQDPQLKPALDLVKSIGAVGEEQIRDAIRFGAATMAAQQAVDDQFTRFQGPYLKRLDGPPLLWVVPK